MDFFITYKFFSILFLLQLKHFFADFVLQNNKIASLKGKDLRYLFLHSFHHSVLSFFVLILFFNFYISALFFIVELAVHSFIDFLKANENLGGRYEFPSKEYFIFLGFDQFLHNLFYLLSLFFFNQIR